MISAKKNLRTSGLIRKQSASASWANPGTPGFAKEMYPTLPRQYDNMIKVAESFGQKVFYTEIETSDDLDFLTPRGTISKISVKLNSKKEKPLPFDE